jgi:hypothetical protein
MLALISMNFGRKLATRYGHILLIRSSAILAIIK